MEERSSLREMVEEMRCTQAQISGECFRIIIKTKLNQFLLLVKAIALTQQK